MSNTIALLGFLAALTIFMGALIAYISFWFWLSDGETWGIFAMFGLMAIIAIIGAIIMDLSA